MGFEPPVESVSLDALVKVRYTKAKEKASVICYPDRIEVEFDEPVSSPTPGQTAAVFNSDGCMLASGFIE
jgi:tRNA U34 2-thiouridine synthase MnmA/TrmU